MKNEKTIDNMVEEKGKSNKIFGKIFVYGSLLFTLACGSCSPCGSDSRPSVPPREDVVAYSLYRVKRIKMDHGHIYESAGIPFTPFKIKVLDDFVNAYIDGNGTINCRDNLDNNRFYQLTYDGKDFVIGPVPTEAKGSHYSGNMGNSL